VLVTTLAPITFPYLLKISFKSVALVREESPETHKLRLNVTLLVPFVGDGAVIFVLTVVVVLVVVELVADEVAEISAISAIIRTENRKLIFNSFFLFVFLWVVLINKSFVLVSINKLSSLGSPANLFGLITILPNAGNNV
jgi:hypothetical protein